MHLDSKVTELLVKLASTPMHCLCIHTCMHTCIHTYTSMLHVCTFIYACRLKTYGAPRKARKHTCAHIYKHAFTYTRTCVHAFKFKITYGAPCKVRLGQRTQESNTRGSLHLNTKSCKYVFLHVRMCATYSRIKYRGSLSLHSKKNESTYVCKYLCVHVGMFKNQILTALCIHKSVEKNTRVCIIQ
jgi:hypothetical protein